MRLCNFSFSAPISNIFQILTPLKSIYIFCEILHPQLADETMDFDFLDGIFKEGNYTSYFLRVNQWAMHKIIILAFLPRN
jgi:hypothetical protein